MNKDTKKDNKRILYFGLVIVFVMLITLGFSYAYFQFTYVNDEPSNTHMESLVLDMEIKGEETIELANAKILTEDEIADGASKFNFEVELGGKSTVDEAIYYLNLTDIDISDNLKSEYFNWSLENEDEEVVASGNFKDLDDDYLKLNEKAIEINKNDIHRYTLKIWLVNDLQVNQNDLLNGNFSAKLTLEGYVKVD